METKEMFETGWGRGWSCYGEEPDEAETEISPEDKEALTRASALNPF